LPQQPDEVLAGDITYIPTARAWLYLAIVIDLCTRRIVGWSLADLMRSELVKNQLHVMLRWTTRQARSLRLCPDFQLELNYDLLIRH
jgi:putative transposase